MTQNFFAVVGIQTSTSIRLPSLGFQPATSFYSPIKINILVNINPHLINFPTIWPQFFTATIYEWQHVLKEDQYKNIIIDSLKYMVQDGRLQVNAFVIMSNHVHIIWQPLKNYSLTQIQSSFMRQTAKHILKLLQQTDKNTLEKLKVNKYDRLYQVWKREPLSVELFTEKAFIQKLDYIHQNPVKANIVLTADAYKYSSASYYELGVDEFDLLTHYAP